MKFLSKNKQWPLFNLKIGKPCENSIDGKTANQVKTNYKKLSPVCIFRMHHKNQKPLQKCRGFFIKQKAVYLQQTLTDANC